MPAYTNQVTVRFDGGDDPFTVKAASQINGGRFISFSDVPAGYPALTNDTNNNLIAAHTTAAAKPDGVARWDAATGEFTSMVRPGSVVQVYASATIAKDVDVEVAANGQSVTKSSGVAAGKAITPGVAGSLHYVLIY